MTTFNVGDKVIIIAQSGADCTTSALIGSVAEILAPFDDGYYRVEYTADFGERVIGYITPESIELASEQVAHATETKTSGGGIMMKRKVKIESKADIKKALLAEQDYLLASLSDAMITQDTETIAKDKARLAEISTELEAL